ncbi:coiled-coil domain-containing protein 42 like-2-like [Labrus bergylta]|uniref:coiled-coil domain-containing protein 42 like-2-like n=1 Tax=Labrus bergylta TaxID=56723 RepID=UPI003313FC3F
MDRKRVPEEEKESRGLQAGSSNVRPGVDYLDKTSTLLDLLKKRRENEELEAQIEDRKKALESLKERTQKMQEKIRIQTELHVELKMLHKEEDASLAAERAEKERTQELRSQEEERRLEEEHVQLMERKEELKSQVERHALYNKYMERVVQMTKFEDVQQLTNHLESLLHFKEQLYQREAESDQQLEEKKKAQVTLKDRHVLVRRQRTSELSQLQAELTGTLSEVASWEKKWNHIQETAAKKTLQLGEIKMAALNAFELTGGNEDEEEPVDINDTEKQLEKVQKFFQDHDEFLRHHQATSPTHKDNGQGKKQGQRVQSGSS